ncbi:MAG TPA: hypothetical protein VJ385_02005 [Fibrobacteria bacterium]|nr:hypothetical protein [Fibrobacteria bacterium]
MRFPSRLLFLCLAASLAAAADLQPRSYAYLLSRATVVAAGKVASVSAGFMSDGRKAVVELDGLIKGRLRTREIEVAWNDKEFEETAYRNDARVLLFLTMAKDSTWSQVSPGISCWPVEKIELKGKRVRAVEYAYPMDLVTEVPAASLRETEAVEKSMNFRVSKRKQWILTDLLLPPVKPLALPKPAPAKPAKPSKAKPARPKQSGAEPPPSKAKAKPNSLF